MSKPKYDIEEEEEKNKIIDTINTSNLLQKKISCSTLDNDSTELVNFNIPYLSNETKEILRENPVANDVKERDGTGSKFYYYSGNTVIDLANKIFGEDGWSCKIIEKPKVTQQEEESGKWKITCECTMRVTLRNGAYREATGGDQMINKNKGEAIINAKKAAETDALKRCMKLFGNKLGLILSDKGFIEDIKVEVKLLKNPKVDVNKIDSKIEKSSKTDNTNEVKDKVINNIKKKCF